MGGPPAGGPFLRKKTIYFSSYGGLNDPSHPFSRLNSDLSLFLSFNSRANVVIATRAGYGKTFGKYEFYQAQFLGATENLRGEPYVTTADTFYTTGIPDMVSADNHTTYALVTLEGKEEDLEQAAPHLRDVVRSTDVEVYVIGQAAVFFDTQTASAEDLVRVERFTFPIVFVLLVLVFGSLIAAGVPLVLGAAGVVVSLAILSVISRLGLRK